MSFDTARFMAAALAPREELVQVPELEAFFAPDEPTAFRVRGLSGEEVFRVAEERRGSELRAAVADALAGGQRAEIAAALKEAIGLGESLPEAMAVAISKVCYGLVDPALDRDQIVRLFGSLPTVGVRLMSAIDELTGRGPDLGKYRLCTPTPESA